MRQSSKQQQDKSSLLKQIQKDNYSKEYQQVNTFNSSNQTNQYMSSDLHQDLPQYFGFGVCSSGSCTKRSQELIKQSGEQNKNDESGNLEESLINERDGNNFQSVQRHNSLLASRLASNSKEKSNLNYLSASKDTSFPQNTFGNYPLTRQYPQTVMNFSHDQQQSSTPFTTPSSNKYSQIAGNLSPQLTDFGRISYNSPNSDMKQIHDPSFSGILQLKGKDIKGQFKQETLSKKSSTDCSDHSKTQIISGKLSESHTPVKIAEKPSQLQGDIDVNKRPSQQFLQQNKSEGNQGVCLNSEESEKDTNNEEHRAQSGSKLSGSRVIDFSGSEVHEYSARNNKQSHRNSQLLDQYAGNNNHNTNRNASPPRILTPLPSVQSSRSAVKLKIAAVPEPDVQMGTSAIVKKANQYLCHQPSQLVTQPTPTNKVNEKQLLKHQSTQPLLENAVQIQQMNLTNEGQLIDPTTLLMNKNENTQFDINNPIFSSIKKYPIKSNIADSNQKRCQSADQSYLRKAHEILESAAKLSAFTPEHPKETKSPRKMADKIKDTFRIINQEEIVNQYLIEPTSKAIIILKATEFSLSARDTNHSTAQIGNNNIGQEDINTKQQELLPEKQQQAQLLNDVLLNPIIGQVVQHNDQRQQEKEEQVKKGAYVPKSNNEDLNKFSPERIRNNQAIISKLLEDSERITKEAIELVAKKNNLYPSYNLPSSSEAAHENLPNVQQQQISMENRFQQQDPLLDDHTLNSDNQSELLRGYPSDNLSDIRFSNSPQFDNQQQQIIPQSQQYNQSQKSEQQYRSISPNGQNHHQSQSSMLPVKSSQPRKSVSPNSTSIIPIKPTKSSELKQKVAQEKLRGQHEEEQKKRERLELRLDQERKRQENHENQIKEQNRILRLQNQKLKEQNNLLLNQFEEKLHDSQDTSIVSKKIKDGSPKGKYQVDISSITNSQSSTQSKQISSQTSPKVKLRSHSNQQFLNNDIPKNQPQIAPEIWSPPDSSTSKPSQQLFRNNSLNSITSLLNSSTQEKQPNSSLIPNQNNMQFLQNPAEVRKQQIYQFEPQEHTSLQPKGLDSLNYINSNQIPQQGIQHGNPSRTHGKIISNQLGSDISSNKYLLVNAAITKGSNSKTHEGRQGLLEVTQSISSARNDKTASQSSAPFQQQIVTSSTRQQALLARFKKPNFSESNGTLSQSKAQSNILCDISKISCASSTSSKAPIKTNLMGSSARSSKSVHNEDNKLKEFDESNESISSGNSQSKLGLKSCQIPKQGFNSQSQCFQVNKNNSNYPGTGTATTTTAIQIDLKSNSSAQGRIRSQSHNQQALLNKGNMQNNNNNNIDSADANILNNAMSSIFQKIENCYNDIGSVYNLPNQEAHN